MDDVSWGVTDGIPAACPNPSSLQSRNTAEAVRYESGSNCLQVAKPYGSFLLNGEDLCPTKKESEVLSYLVGHAGEVCSRTELGEALYGQDRKSHKRSIDTYVKNLRAKLGEDSTHPRWIETIQGVGYRFIGRRAE